MLVFASKQSSSQRRLRADALQQRRAVTRAAAHWRGWGRMRLASSSAASQLNQGYLISQSPTSAQRGSYRGSGFELRTDAWGVLRAPQGLLISTTTRSGVGGGVGITSTQMDTAEARAQLKGAQSLTDALQAAASQSQALGNQQVKDTQTAQKLLLERLDPTQKGSYRGQGQTSLNGQTTQKTLTSGDKAGRDLDTAPEAAVEKFGAPLIVAEVYCPNPAASHET